MKKAILLIGLASTFILSGCERGGSTAKKSVPAAALAEQPEYFIRPADVEAAIDHCDGELDGFAVTNQKVPVLHFICNDGASYRMDLGTGKVFKRTVL